MYMRNQSLSMLSAMHLVFFEGEEAFAAVEAIVHVIQVLYQNMPNQLLFVFIHTETIFTHPAEVSVRNIKMQEQIFAVFELVTANAADPLLHGQTVPLMILLLADFVKSLSADTAQVFDLAVQPLDPEVISHNDPVAGGDPAVFPLFQALAHVPHVVVEEFAVLGEIFIAILANELVVYPAVYEFARFCKVDDLFDFVRYGNSVVGVLLESVLSHVLPNRLLVYEFTAAFATDETAETYIEYVPVEVCFCAEQSAAGLTSYQFYG